ncbi:unnamed protein product [Peniophora sp. CBMAI 1063]|nr:unnamed protein product [Peniophora sp. CBMAI 1063]
MPNDMQNVDDLLYSDVWGGSLFEEPPLFPTYSPAINIPSPPGCSIESEPSAEDAYASNRSSSSPTEDTSETTAIADIQTILPALLSRIGQLVWPLESLLAPPTDAMPVCYSAILPFALRNTDEINIAPTREGEPTDERELRYRSWFKAQHQASAYEHWLSRGGDTCALRLEHLNSRSRARQAAYMQRRRRCSHSSTTTALIASPLRYRLDENSAERHRTGICNQCVVTSQEVDSDEGEGSDVSWGEEWDETFSLSSDDYGELDTSQEEGTSSWRERPIPLDERYGLVYGPSVMFSPRVASLMGFPQSSWALWLPSENEERVDVTADLDDDYLREWDVLTDAPTTHSDEVSAPGSSTAQFDPPVIPICATRLAACAHSGRLSRRSRTTAMSRAAARSHLKLAAWVLTTIKLGKTDFTDLYDLPQEEQVIGSDDFDENTMGIPAPPSPGSSAKRARAEDECFDGDDGALSRHDARPLKRIHM